MRRATLSVLAALLALPAWAETPRGPTIPFLIPPAQDARRVSVTVDRGLRDSRRLPNDALRAARVALQAGDPVAVPDLRRLAEAGDGLAAQRYVRVLLADPASADPSDIAYFSAIAVATGRIWTLVPMIEAMHRLDPATEPPARVRKLIDTIYPHAWAGNSLALDALLAFNGEGRLFGPLSDRTRQRILAQARKTGDGRTELSLALGILEAQRRAAAPDAAAMAQARDYLDLARGSDHLAVRTTAENLLRLLDGG